MHTGVAHWADMWPNKIHLRIFHTGAPEYAEELVVKKIKLRFFLLLQAGTNLVGFLSHVVCLDRNARTTSKSRSLRQAGRTTASRVVRYIWTGRIRNARFRSKVSQIQIRFQYILVHWSEKVQDLSHLGPINVTSTSLRHGRLNTSTCHVVSIQGK